MKRFWREAAADAAAQGFGVVLDGRPLRTPAGHALMVSQAPLASALAAEWQAAPDPWGPADLPLTGLVNAALDHVAPAPATFAAQLATFAPHDTLLQRAPPGDPVAAALDQAAEPIVRAVEAWLDARFARAAGIMPLDQPRPATAAVERAYAALPPLVLAALSPVVTITASALAGLALAQRLADADAIWAAGLAEELLQAQRWGEDADAAASRALRRGQFDAGVRLLGFAWRVEDRPGRDTPPSDG